MNGSLYKIRALIKKSVERMTSSPHKKVRNLGCFTYSGQDMFHNGADPVPF